jgi:hypothetical protein
MGTLNPQAPSSITVHISFFGYRGPTGSIDSYELAVGAFLLQELIETLNQLFETIGLPTAYPLIDVRPGSLKVVLKKGVQGAALLAGLLLLADVATGGAMLPLTAPIWAKMLTGAGLTGINVFEWIQAQRKLNAEIENLKEQTNKLHKEAEAIEAKTIPERQKLIEEARKTRLEADELARKLQESAEIAPNRYPASLALSHEQIRNLATRYGLAAADAAAIVNIGMPRMAWARQMGAEISITSGDQSGGTSRASTDSQILAALRNIAEGIGHLEARLAEARPSQEQAAKGPTAESSQGTESESSGSQERATKQPGPKKNSTGR